MPKERRKRSAGHEPSVKLPKREFAVQDNAVERVKIGDAIDASGAQILESLSAPETRPVTKKKEKLQQKHEAFLQRLDTSSSPYSKSHARRVKRKAKEQIASGLSEMQVAISALDEDIPIAVQQSVKDSAGSGQEPQSKAHVKLGMIGEGKKVPLSRSQRKRALQTEQVRHPLILSNPDFAANPFQTIRTHAQNTLVKRQVPSNSK
ncbi:ribosome biogenesis protein SLX9-domain-containing protein [Lyophyllum atratum]|nr:ribosome biogenesis protein SLX9-domain-containing protein [Lyophyllum atratum]